MLQKKNNHEQRRTVCDDQFDLLTPKILFHHEPQLPLRFLLRKFSLKPVGSFEFLSSQMVQPLRVRGEMRRSIMLYKPNRMSCGLVALAGFLTHEHIMFKPRGRCSIKGYTIRLSSIRENICE